MKSTTARWGLGLLGLLLIPGVGLADVKPHVLFTDGRLYAALQHVSASA